MKGYLIGGGVVLLILAIAGFAWFERHQGAAAKTDADKIAMAQRQAQNAKTEAASTVEVAKEGTTYDATLNAPIAAPVVQLCHYAPVIVPAAHPAGPALHAAPSDGDRDLPGPREGGLPVPGPDIGEPLLADARRADAKIAGLQAYIRAVCLVPPPP